jgi:hypothetical protein
MLGLAPTVTVAIIGRTLVGIGVAMLTVRQRYCRSHLYHDQRTVSRLYCRHRNRSGQPSQNIMKAEHNANSNLITGTNQRCIPGSVRFFSGFCNDGVRVRVVDESEQD